MLPADPQPTQPTPDELLLELMDLVTLAFPAPLHEMTVTFVPNEDGKRPALTDLAGKARPDAPKRPALGHGDSEILDAINTLLTDFADATLRQGGVRVLRGRIHIEEDSDGARHVALTEDVATDDSPKDELVMTRRFDKSELRWLFFTPELFSALNGSEAREHEQATAMQEALRGLGRFDIDMKKGVITFSGGDVGARVWTFELIGSFLDEGKRFLWGWANDQVDARLTRALNSWREQQKGHGLRALTEASFGGPEAFFERLARHAALSTGAAGVYRAPFSSRQGKGVMYLALRNLEQSAG